MSGRFIFCKTERVAYTTIQEVTSKFGAHVFPHLRIKEVANRPWIDEADFDYALKGHIDFTVAVDFKPVLALELDGKFHQNPKARERDKKKDAVCDALDIPLVRLDYGFMRPDLLRPLVAQFIEEWLCRRDTASRDELNKMHTHWIEANPLQLDELKVHCRRILELPDDTPCEVNISTTDEGDGYTDSVVELVFPVRRYKLGTGRARVPKNSRLCGRLLSERIAVTQAGYFVRTCGGTTFDTACTDAIVLQSNCSSCSESEQANRTVALQMSNAILPTK